MKCPRMLLIWNWLIMSEFLSDFLYESEVKNWSYKIMIIKCTDRHTQNNNVILSYMFVVQRLVQI